MAKIKFGNIVVDMRGKVAGNVYSKNKGGAYCRVKVKPSNPKSSAQSDVRAIFTLLSQAWRGLTEIQRLSWSQGVGNFPRKNSLGDTHNLSGNALFVSLNKNLAAAGIAQIDTCPAPEAVDSVAVLTAVASVGGQTLVVTLVGAVPANTSLMVNASPTMSAGVKSVGSKLRTIVGYAAAHAAALTLTTPYLAKFGVIGAVDSKIFIELVPINETTGQKGAAIRAEVVITA